ncbi:MAG: MaoC family dehydratase N-terminal domain-containing protein [Thermoleophilia bacterium]|nr:MaoC family dehydratase N-terminal domain-containing protein [Thermoleophilia bacterium]
MELNRVFGSGFDDLVVGAEFSTYGRTITESDLTAFSGLTGDHHPLHTDAEWASRSLFGERIAHGMLLLSYSVGLAPIDPERVAALRGFEKVVFKRPVRIGDTITLNGRVEELKPLDPDTGLVRILWKVKNQDGALVLRALAEIVWRRGADGGEDPQADEAPEANADRPGDPEQSRTEPVSQ